MRYTRAPEVYDSTARSPFRCDFIIRHLSSSDDRRRAAIHRQPVRRHATVTSKTIQSYLFDRRRLPHCALAAFSSGRAPLTSSIRPYRRVGRKAKCPRRATSRHDARCVCRHSAVFSRADEAGAGRRDAFTNRPTGAMFVENAS